WDGCASSKHIHCGQGRQRKTGNGVLDRNESSYHPGISPRIEGNFVGNVRGRHQTIADMRQHPGNGLGKGDTPRAGRETLVESAVFWSASGSLETLLLRKAAPAGCF